MVLVVYFFFYLCLSTVSVIYWNTCVIFEKHCVDYGNSGNIGIMDVVYLSLPPLPSMSLDVGQILQILFRLDFHISIRLLCMGKILYICSVCKKMTYTFFFG